MGKKPPFLKDTKACLQCGYCKSVCPVASVTGWESFSPSGKVFYLKHFSNKGMMDRIFGKKFTNWLTDRGKIKLDDAMERIFRCTLCSACEQICHVNIPFHEYWEEIRTWIVESGVGPPKAAKNMYANIAKPEFKNPFMEKVEKRDEWYRDDYQFPKKADIVYFIGCNTSFYEYQVLLNNLKIFKKAGVSITTLGQDEMCCGTINAMTGQLDNFTEIANYNVGHIKKRGATRVVTGCPGCLRCLKKYKNYVDFDLPVIHTTQLIWEIIQEGKLEFKKEFKSKDLPVAYHDPCELGRISEYEGYGIFDEPRNILKAIPGIDEVLEFPKNRMESQCCGGGGGLKAVDFDLSTKIGARKVDAAIELETKTMVSCCPNCKSQIGIGIENKKDEYKKRGEKLKMKAIDLSEVVGKLV